MVDEAGRALYKAAHGPAAREFQAVMRYAVLTPQEQARAIQDIIRGGPDGTGAVRDGEHNQGHDCDEESTCRRCRRKRSGRGLNGATLLETSLVRP